ncbi:MAG: TonB-dependent receptor family protein [Bacteroidetes bacterium]|nr:TonB-dependent receptor family protein [Bacteroidota bacterium]
MKASDPVVAVPSEKGKIEGEVVDGNEKVPVEYANILVMNPGDSSMVTGGLTDLDGRFQIKDIPLGDYYVVVNFIGYEKRMIDNVKVTKKNQHIDLGKIDLNMTAVQLKAAEITAERMAVEYHLDRKVVNVAQDLDAAGNSAVEVLEKVPSIRVDISGEVSLRGSSNFTVLIDGKPSVLQGSEALQQIPSSTIENIEIITNPSVKYDPDGTAGIINIKLKKNRIDGLGGVVNATVGTGDKYASDLYLNYKTGKFNIFGGIDWNDRKFYNESTENRETINNDTSFFQNSFGEGAWLRNGLRLKGGLDFTPNDNTTWSVGGEYGDFGFGMDNYQHVKQFSQPASSTRYYINDDQRRWKRNFYSLNGSFKKEFAGENHELTLYGFYSNRDGSEKQDKIEYDTDANWNSIDSDPFLLRTDESGPSYNIRTEMDYTRPVGEEGKMEFGYHYRRGIDNEDYTLQTFDYDASAWITDDDFTKNTFFERDIHAVYSTYSNSYKSFEYQLGLRGEYTYRNIEVSNTGESSLIDRFDYFPSLHVSNRFNDNNQVMASYSRRIDRPRGWYLEPYESFVDENTRRLGNPALLPEYTDSYELGYLRTLSAGNVSVDVYYRKTDNKITNISYVDQETGILYYQFQNLNSDQALGIEGAFIYDLTKWFNLNLSGTFYNYKLDDKTSESGGTKTSNNWDSRLIGSFKLPTNTRFQVNLSYESPTVEAQGREEESYYADVTVRQDFFEKKFNVTLKVGDVFATRTARSYRNGPDFYISQTRIPESRVVTLTLSYRLNNFKERQDRRSEMGGDM